MKRIAFPAAVLAVAIVLGCGGYASPDGPGNLTPATSTVWIVNASRAQIDVTIDGARVMTGLSIAGVSTQTVAPGAHLVHLQAPGSTGTDLTVNAPQGAAVTAVAQSSIEGALLADTLADTGSVAVVGKSKVRVVHMAGSAPPVDIWRTQPDFQTPTRVMFPFPYGSQSPYLQSDPGTWTVYVTSTTDWNTKLADAGTISVGSGEVKTVVLLDSAGVLKLRALSDR